MCGQSMYSCGNGTGLLRSLTAIPNATAVEKGLDRIRLEQKNRWGIRPPNIPTTARTVHHVCESRATGSRFAIPPALSTE